MRQVAAIALAAAGLATLSSTTDALSSTSAESLRAAQACGPPVAEASTEPNIFSEEQETFLGDAIADMIIKDFRVIEDATITAPLAAIGERLMKRLPPSRLRLQFFLIDLPEANAFVLPGGRIFVSRKMVSFVASEDELAGVLAHELGHLVTRQLSIAVSRQFKSVLGITSVGDRQDVVEKFHLLLDNDARNPGAFRQSQGHETRDQIAADRMGVFLLASAGYEPQSFAKFWDRFAETDGKTGGFFTNLFGMTSPESRRLKEAIKTSSAVAPSCIAATAPNATPAAFDEWRSTVRTHTAQAPREALKNVVSRTKLDPALRSDITHLRFSPDGRHVLAQDDGGITVLTRSPFAPVFRIDAPEAEPASFTPDSTRVVFHTTNLRVETWRVADRRRDAVHELVIRSSCAQTAVAPDGRTLACLDTDLGINLYNVATGAAVYQKKRFFEPDLRTMLMMMLGDLDAGSIVDMGFSTDGRYFAAGYRGYGGASSAVVLYDIVGNVLLAPKGDARKFIAEAFVFTGPDRMIARNPDNPTKSAVIALPNAEIAGPADIMSGSLTAATKGNYLFVRPVQKFAVGVLDVAKATVTKGLTTSAIDVHDDVFVAERGTGELGLYSFSTNQLTAQTALPPTALGRLRAAAVSPDLKYLAVSERSRGGLWDLSGGRRVVLSRGFRGADIDETGGVVIDLPRFRDEKRRIAQMDAARGNPLGTVDLADPFVTQAGGLLIVRTQIPKGPSVAQAFTLDVRDARTSASLWQRKFHQEAPGIDADPASGRIIIVWPAASEIARGEARRDPELRRRLGDLKEPDGDLILQILDGRTGRSLGTIFVETGKGSFSVLDVATHGDWVAVEDSDNRTRLYSLSTGELKGRVFGSEAVVNGDRSVFAVQNGSRLSVYDAKTMQVRDELVFSRPMAFTSFNKDGSKLLVLTTDHTAFVIGVGEK